MISIIIPVYNASASLRQCLEAVYTSQYQDYECLVVDDGSTDDSRDLARQFPTRLIETSGGPFGPAHARNRGAEAAAGEILFFIDSDVTIRPDTLALVAEAFALNPQTAALFGSYDESPARDEFLSQYKNLLHHFVHQQGRENASTFWSGCGAVRREVFLQVGGFDAQRYPRPSIEDIELGYRLRTAGHSILLVKEIQVKHLKPWSLWGLVKTDILYRAIPWALLILKYRNLPNDLNLQFSQRLSTLLLVAMLLYLGLFAFQNNLVLLPLITGLALLLISSWRGGDEQRSFQMSRPVEQSSYLLMSSIGVLALFSNKAQLMAPLALLLPLTLVGQTLSQGGVAVRRLIFAAMMLAIGTEFALLLASYPLQLVLPFLALLALILLLNSQLYLFFARKRGLAFALATIPLQLMYYFYSVLAFLIGGGIHFWNTNLKPRLRQPAG